MYKRPGKPKPKFRSVRQAKTERFIYWGTWGNRDAEWLCFKCMGKGRIHKDEDCCPIEGFTHSPFYECKKCGGTGEGTREEFMEWYDKEQLKRQAAIDKHKAIVEQRRLIRKKLTRTDIKFIKEHGIDHG